MQSQDRARQCVLRHRLSCRPCARVPECTAGRPGSPSLSPLSSHLSISSLRADTVRNKTIRRRHTIPSWGGMWRLPVSCMAWGMQGQFPDFPEFLWPPPPCCGTPFIGRNKKPPNSQEEKRVNTSPIRQAHVSRVQPTSSMTRAPWCTGGDPLVAADCRRRGQIRKVRAGKQRVVEAEVEGSW